MAVPLSLALPAAAAGAAYLNAKASLWYDARLLSCVIPSSATMFWRDRTDALNPFYVLERTAQNKASAQRTFVIFEGKSHTYAQVYETVLKYGTWLRERHGVKPKDIVAMNFQNSDVFVFIWFGLWSIGAKPAFINYNLTGAALIHSVKSATTSLMLIDPHVAEHVDEEVQKALDAVKLVVVTPEVEADIASMSPHRVPDADRSEEGYQNIGILIYTSGTTGLPKPAIVSFGKSTVVSNFVSRLLKMTTQDVYYTAMPLYHSSAALLCLLSTLETGSTIAIGRKFSTKTFWPEVRSSGATLIQYVGETCRYLLAAPPQLDPETGENLDQKHKVRAAFGNGLRPDVWNLFKERFGVEAIGEFYASTEGNFATFNYSRNDFSKGAIGRNGLLYHALIGLNVSVVDVDIETGDPWRDPKTGLCRAAKPGQPGEMLFRVATEDVGKRFQGYYNNKEATMAKLMRDVFRKGDSWFRTGDMVRWDSEGLLYFNDRMGDTFRWKSENVSTQEVSGAIGSHPAVMEANVYGVELPHHDGRAGCAAVVIDEGTGIQEQPREELLRELAGHVKRELPKFALPLFLRVMPRMGSQMTGTNKQQKTTLQKEGVHLEEGTEGVMYWLKGDRYERFSEEDWRELDGGRLKL